MTNKVTTEKSRCSSCMAKNQDLYHILTHILNKSHYKTLTYCLKCKKDAKNIDSKMLETKKRYHQIVLYVVVKNQDL